jgi:oxygen-independent coproporphyrinogen-3 oxidase
VEEGTPLSENEELLDMIPDEDSDRRMYAMTKKILRANGYDRYEFSNYAKPGFECQHNIVYWTGGEYIGLGLGSASMFKGERFSNTRVLTDYIDLMKEAAMGMTPEADKLLLYDKVTGSLRKDRTAMYVDRRMEEYMFLGLRMTKGVNRKDFKERFNKDMFDIYGPVINQRVAEGFMDLDDTYVHLTDAGIDVSNIILADFLLDQG